MSKNIKNIVGIVRIARGIALDEHAGGTRKDGITPYIVHPARVADLLQHESDEVVATAWLHDVLESSEQPASDLKGIGLPDCVIKAVDVLTHREGPYEAYINKVMKNAIARRVKVADIVSNLTDSPSKQQIDKYAKALLFLVG